MIQFVIIAKMVFRFYKDQLHLYKSFPASEIPNAEILQDPEKLPQHIVRKINGFGISRNANAIGQSLFLCNGKRAE